MRRDSWKSLLRPIGIGATLPVVLWLVVILAFPNPRRVSGSVPAAPAGAEAVFESQGEFELAGRSLTVDSTRVERSEWLQARARVAARSGHHAEALREIESHPGRLDPGFEALWRAALQLRTGAPEQALQALQGITPPAGTESFAALVEAEAAAALGRWDHAQQAVERVTDASLPQEMRQRLLVVRGLVARNRNDMGALRRLAPDLGEAARRDDRTGILLLQLARATAQSGDVRQAREWLFDLLEARPTPAESSYVELLRSLSAGDASATPSVLRLARFEARSGRGDAARTRLQAALRATRPAIDAAELRLALAESQLRSGDPQTCLKTLERAAAESRSTRFEAERLRLRARAQRRLGQREAAMATYREIGKRFPSHPIADDALYEVGWLHETNGELRGAEQAYVRCARVYPDGPLADDNDLRAGLCALRDRRPAEAAVHLAELAKEHPNSSLLENALYWQMLAQVELGDPTGALVLRDRLERDFPRSYFTYLARQRIERGLMTSPSTTPVEVTPAPRAAIWPVDSGLERARRATAAYDDAIATLRRAGLSVPGDFETQTRLWRFLLDAGLATEANWETRRLEKRYDDQPGALLELIAHSHARGAHQRLVRLSHLLGQRVTDPTYREALEILLYPAPYAPTLAEVAARHGLSHAAVLGLMRQESAFDSRIDSAVGARGLMQLMPEVGRRLASGAGRTGFHTDELYVPAVNIELGCVLLAEELQRAAGRLPQALAAYNAGGDVAEKWATRLRPQDPAEMYVDLAEYAETRSYLENVLGNIETYRRLYALP